MVRVSRNVPSARPFCRLPTLAALQTRTSAVRASYVALNSCPAGAHVPYVLRPAPVSTAVTTSRSGCTRISARPT